MDVKQLTIAALEDEVLVLEDYEPGAVLVFVDGQLLADSETPESAAAMVARAEGYGETGCWVYAV